MDKSHIFKGLATAGIALTLIIASRGVSISEDDDLITPQGDDPREDVHSIEPPPLTIFFGYESRELSKKNLEQVKEAADYLIETGETFEIRGCTDKTGTEDSNYWLSYHRANAVLNALEDFGVPVTRYMKEYDDQGNLVEGQDRDIDAEGENCPPLVEGEPDNQEESRRADIILNPEY